jgi:hypothetical protein
VPETRHFVSSSISALLVTLLSELLELNRPLPWFSKQQARWRSSAQRLAFTQGKLAAGHVRQAAGFPVPNHYLCLPFFLLCHCLPVFFFSELLAFVF